MDPIQGLYMRLRGAESKVVQCDQEAKDASDEVKAAYSTIKSVHLSTITAVKIEMATTISTLMGK